jgi:hypothetical protein
MPIRYSIRAYQRFPVECGTYYLGATFLGEGRVQNVSRMGWRIEGDVPVTSGILLTVSLRWPGWPEPIRVDQAIVRWTQGRVFGIRIVTMTATEAARLNHVIATRIQQHLSGQKIAPQLNG